MGKPSYTVKTEGDLIIVDAFGTFTAVEVKNMQAQIAAEILRGIGTKDVLVRAEGAGSSKKSSLEQSIKGMMELPLRRLAVSSNHPDRIEAARHIVKGGDDSRRYKLFRREEDARAWLQG